jgi:hypothetical protein
VRVYENRVLRRIFGPKREEVAGGWRRLHNEELHNLYASTNIITVIKSRTVRWGEACSTHGRSIQYFGCKNLKRRIHSKGLDVDMKIIFQWIFGQ